MVRKLTVIAVGAALWMGVAGCEDRGGGDRRAAGTGSGGDRTAGGAGPRGAEMARPGSAQGATTVTGKVVSAKSDELVVKPQGDERELKLKVDASTQVLLDGKRSSVSDLREGTEVRASLDRSQGEPRALRIEATGGGAAAGTGRGDQPGGSAGTTGGLGGSSSRTPGQTGGPGGESSTSAGQPAAPSGGEYGSGGGR